MNHKHRNLLLGIITLSMMIGMSACQNDNSSKNVECDPECDKGQTCIDGECVDEEDSCDTECKKGQKCVDGECKKIEDDDDDDSCDPKCKKGQKCVDGECKKIEEEEKTCDPECGIGMECIDGKCEINELLNKEIELEEDECKNIKCDENEKCIKGECEKLCGSIVCSSEQLCVEDVCVLQSELCGQILCSSEQKCLDGACVERTKCDDWNCPSGEECVLDNNLEPTCLSPECIVNGKLKSCPKTFYCLAGACLPSKCEEADTDPETGECIVKIESIVLKMETDDAECSEGSLDPKTNKCNIEVTDKTVELLRNSKIRFNAVIKPSDVSNGNLTWTTEVVSNNNQSEDASSLATMNASIHKATITNITDSARTIKVTVTSNDGSNISSSVQIKLKPYSDYRTYQYGTYTYSDNTKKTYISCGTFDDTETFKTFNRDLYTKYVLPKMIEKDGKHYGTRASVVAAARFLILQFPYFIPYYSCDASISKFPTESRYSWANGEKATTGQDVRIFGLNLTPNAYNSYDSKDKTVKDGGGIVKSDVIPWGCGGDNTYQLSCTKPYDENAKLNGLSCSGFVSWAFRNGRMYLGDWWTHIFKHETDKYERNYLDKDMVNGITNPNRANPNNVHDGVYTKLKELNPETDFVKIAKLTEKDLKTIKAGDLLWHCGHIAMIIGIDREKNNIWVGEASRTHAYDDDTNTKGMGNIAIKYSLDYLKNKSKWSRSTCDGKKDKNGKTIYDDENQSCIIKMGSVYNYYSKKYKINNNGDEYGYTDMWTDEHQALTDSNDDVDSPEDSSSET